MTVKRYFPGLFWVLMAMGAMGAMMPDAKWITAAGSRPVAAVCQRKGESAAGTSWFVAEPKNRAEVRRAVWSVTALGVFEAYVNRQRLGDETEVLKPGFTSCTHTRYAWTYDVTAQWRRGAGETNLLSAEVSSGWWRDQVVCFHGKRSAFRGELTLEYVDGSRETFNTDTEHWRAGEGGPVRRAGIFDGEFFDAREKPPFEGKGFAKPVENSEFKGEVLPVRGARVFQRRDLAMKPVEVYVWKGVEGADEKQFGKVKRLRDYGADEKIKLNPGETLIVDFGQNSSAVPRLKMRAAAGTRVTGHPAEVLNEAAGERSRGNDGPAGSAYRTNLRNGNLFWFWYTFDERPADWIPRFTFFGYRYLSLTTTGEVEFDAIESVPVTSIAADRETAKLETGDPAVNQLFANTVWGMRSNYLSVPTDCPQRDERQGWTGDTQVFAETGTYLADVTDFFHKWMRDVRDAQNPRLGNVASCCPAWPCTAIGNSALFGWEDAGIIVPWTLWKQTGDRRFIDDYWDVMEKLVGYVDRTENSYKGLANDIQTADHLSFEQFEWHRDDSYASGKFRSGKPTAEAEAYWDFLGACYWLMDARMMARMAEASGRKDAAEKYRAMAAKARARIGERFLDAEGDLRIEGHRAVQGAALFGLHVGLFEGAVKEKVKARLRKNFKEHGWCLQTGFLGTSILMDALTEAGMEDVAWEVVLNHNFPSWLYSVDQGATTIWERWNSYTKEKGFGPAWMNSFNHYAYGAVMGWFFKSAAGIAADPERPGFKRILMKPVPNRRLGFLKAEYRSAAGTIKSAWRYEGDQWIWDFTIPAGTTALVTLPGAKTGKVYSAGTYNVRVNSGVER